MNGFIMWMSGNTISIFPIMMVVMMTLRPIKTLFSVNSTFKAIDVADGGGGVVGVGIGVGVGGDGGDGGDGAGGGGGGGAGEWWWR